MTTHKLASLVLVLAFSALGCADDAGGGGGGTGGSGGSGGSGGGGNLSCPGGEDVTGCTAVLSPGSDDAANLQTAFIEAKSGDTVCLCKGTYSLTKEVSLAVPQITVKGLGANIDDVVIDFAGQTQGDDGVTVTSDGFTVENLGIKNSPGNGIVVTGAEDVTFRKLKVWWDAGSVTSNGAYAIYPVKSTRVIIEDSEIIGAADAGAYVGQCNQAIVRRNKVHGNVAGIEIENTTDAEVYDNEAWDNSSGILVFTLPNLEKKDGARAKVHDNKVHDNNRDNFAESGTIVSNVPAGTGVLLMGSDETELANNVIENNKSVGILIVSLTTLDLVLQSKPDPATDPDPEKTYIFGNTFKNNGTDPQTILAQFNIKPLEDVVWDGVRKTTVTDGTLCLGDGTPPSYRNIHAPAGLVNPGAHTTDATPHQCKLPELPTLSW